MISNKKKERISDYEYNFSSYGECVLQGKLQWKTDTCLCVKLKEKDTLFIREFIKQREDGSFILYASSRKKAKYEHHKIEYDDNVKKGESINIKCKIEIKDFSTRIHPLLVEKTKKGDNT